MWWQNEKAVVFGVHSFLPPCSPVFREKDDTASGLAASVSPNHQCGDAQSARHKLSFKTKYGYELSMVWQVLGEVSPVLPSCVS